MPGLPVGLPDAESPPAVITVPVVLPPSTNITGTLMYCGVVFGDCRTMLARYTPGSNPTPEAVSVICAVPTPASCETLSHPVVRFAGKTEALHGCVLSVRFTVSFVCTGWSAVAAARLTLAG